MLAVRRLELTAANGIRAADRTGAAFRRSADIARPLPALQRGGQWALACGARRCAWLCLFGVLGEAHASGTSVNGIRHEDLEALSFDDDTIDVGADKRRVGACR